MCPYALERSHKHQKLSDTKSHNESHLLIITKSAENLNFTDLKHGFYFT